MNTDAADPLVNALLYEGYILYPYRPSVKNAQRWTFGSLYPAAWAAALGEPETLRTQCLVDAPAAASISLQLRFLHLIDRRVGDLPQPLDPSTDLAAIEPRWVTALECDGQLHQTWQEAQERRADADPLTPARLRTSATSVTWTFPGRHWREPITDAAGRVAAILDRRQERLAIELRAAAEPLNGSVHRLTLELFNRTAVPARFTTRDDALLRAAASTHLLLQITGGRFISLTDPPPRHAAAAAGCRNRRFWPVLVGDPDAADTLLVTPIILQDYPQVAPESPGDLFDATEIDEILSLRIATLTDAEKRAAAATDPRARDLIRRTERVARQQLSNLHGTIRELRPAPAPPFRPGDRVRIEPRAGGDVFDLALAGLTARVTAVEQDLEGRTHVAVVVDDDPGSELGLAGQPGHRFFFRPEELQPLHADRSPAS